MAETTLVAQVSEDFLGLEECRELIALGKAVEATSYRHAVSSATLPLILQTLPALLVPTLAIRGARCSQDTAPPREAHQPYGAAHGRVPLQVLQHQLQDPHAATVLGR
jgi:hypothetical protein